MYAASKALFVRELRVAGRIGGGAATGVLFFFTLVTLTPFAIGPDLPLLARIGPAVLWIAALLATLLGLDRLFQSDEEDGSLDLMLLADAPLEWIVLVKCLAHWTLSCLPLVAAAPLFGAMLGLAPGALAGVTISLLIGTPALTFLGAIGAALTATLRRGGLLSAVLILPLCVPILIFGVAAAQAFGGAPGGLATPLLVSIAFSLAAGVGAPLAASAALRHLRE